MGKIKVTVRYEDRGEDILLADYLYDEESDDVEIQIKPSTYMAVAATLRDAADDIEDGCHPSLH